ncbi:hypothetical protein FKM82_008651 [Ascaphus truei]
MASTNPPSTPKKSGTEADVLREPVSSPTQNRGGQGPPTVSNPPIVLRQYLLSCYSIAEPGLNPSAPSFSNQGSQIWANLYSLKNAVASVRMSDSRQLSATVFSS